MKYIFLFLITFNCMAQNVVTVKKGDVVPFDGVLFTKEKELQIRQDILEKEALDKKVKLLEELGKVQEEEIDLANKRINNYRKQITEYADREVRTESREFWKSALYFTAGALITGAIGYGVIRA